MGVCWYCHWGWAKPVKEIHDRFEAIAGEEAMHYGPAHIVWADENFEREHVEYCLGVVDDAAAHWNDGRFTREQLEAVRESLKALLALSDDVLAPEPPDYDDEHPENFPPAVEMAAKY